MITLQRTAETPRVQSQVQLTGHGGIDNLSVVETSVPTPGPGEVLLRVQYAGVAFADVMMRHGKYFGTPELPFTPGYDVVGVVVARGDGSQVALGTRLLALTRYGGYAQYVRVPEAGAARVPDSVEPSKALCLGLNYLSAYQMLHRCASLKAGQRLLVFGAAGGVGSAALQLANLMGVQCVGAASASKAESVRACGGQAVDYRAPDFESRLTDLAPGGFDAVLDPVGPANWPLCRRHLKPRGTLVGYGLLADHDRSSDTMQGNAAGFMLNLLLAKLRPTRQRFTFYGVSTNDLAQTRSDLEALLELLRLARIDPIIADILPLAEAGKAHRLLTASQVTGKLILQAA